MASPHAALDSSGHPLTPPAEPASQSQTSSTQPQTQSQTFHSSQSQRSSINQIETLLAQPSTSLSDSGATKRPRDHRIIHLLLASHGVAAYQDRVPLQLMDFAYRYASGVLSDAVHIQNEGYDQANDPTAGGGGGTGRKGKGGGGAGADKDGGGGGASGTGDVSLSALRMAISSRMQYQFQGALPREFLKELADERNRVALGTGLRDTGVVIGGVKLPSEKYCLTGVGWGLKDEWDSEGEETVDVDLDLDTTAEGVGAGGAGLMGFDGPGGDEDDEDGMEGLEDVFGGDDDEGGDGADKDEGDEEMEDS